MKQTLELTMMIAVITGVIFLLSSSMVGFNDRQLASDLMLCFTACLGVTVLSYLMHSTIGA
jgi:hypothetical protein